MQPEQQNQNGQNQPYDPGAQQPPVQSTSNIPDYLHLDPIETAAPVKRGGSRKVIIIILSVLLLIIMSILAASYFLPKSPQERFYQALRSGLETKYVNRKVSVSVDDPATTYTVTSQSDLTDPTKPKSLATFDYALPEETAGGTDVSEKVRLSGTSAFVTDQRALLKYTHLPSTGYAQLQTDKWYNIAYSDAKNIRELDFLNLRQMINNPLLTTPAGLFNGAVSDSIVDYIKSKGTYTVTSSRDDSLSGKNVTVYEVETSAKKLRDLGAKIGELLKVDALQDGFADLGEPISMTLWVDNGSNKIVKETFKTARINAVAGASDQSLVPTTSRPSNVTVTVENSYPDTASITEPADARNIPSGK